MSNRTEDTRSFRSNTRQQETEFINGENFRIGADVACLTPTVVPPEDVAPVPINIGLSDLELLSATRDAFATTRSRFAQIGLEVDGEGPLEILRSLEEDPRDPNRFTANVPVLNYSSRPVSLGEGTRFFYMYSWNQQTLTGYELISHIGRDILISGEEGDTWRFWYGTYSSGRVKDIQGIEFFLDEKSRRCIKPGDEPIVLDDGNAHNHNRFAVDQYLTGPLPQTDVPMLWIAETKAEFELTPAVNGIVEMEVSTGDHPTGFERNGYLQTNSILIRGGNTYGRMRTEIISPTTPDVIPQTSLVRFAKA